MVIGVVWIATLAVLALRTDWTAAVQRGDTMLERIINLESNADTQAQADQLRGMALWVIPLSALGVAAAFVLGMLALARSVRKGDRWARWTAAVALPLFLWLELASLLRSGTWIESIEALLAAGLTVAAGWYLLLSPASRGYVRRYL